LSDNFFSFEGNHFSRTRTFEGSGKFLDGRRRCQGFPAIMGHLRGPPQGPEVRLRSVGRHPDVLRHRESRVIGKLQRDVVPSGRLLCIVLNQIGNTLISYSYKKHLRLGSISSMFYAQLLRQQSCASKVKT
jgi:hypothetical protein